MYVFFRVWLDDNIIILTNSFVSLFYFISSFGFSSRQIDKLISTLTQQVQVLEKAADEFRVANGLGLSKDENANVADDDIKTGGGILV